MSGESSSQVRRLVLLGLNFEWDFIMCLRVCSFLRCPDQLRFANNELPRDGVASRHRGDANDLAIRQSKSMHDGFRTIVAWHRLCYLWYIVDHVN